MATLIRRRTVGAGTVLALLAAVGLLASSAAAEPPAPPSAPAAPIGTVAEPGGVRQTAAEARAAAQATGRRIEVGAFRGERREVWVNPDGTVLEIQHQEPYRVVQRGAWVPVDTTLVREADGTVRPRAAAIGLRLSGGGSGQPFAAIERVGRRMSLSWGGILPTPVLDGDTATYPEVLPGTDLVVHARPAGFSHVFVIRTPEAARRAAQGGLAFGLATHNLTVREGRDEQLSAVDPATGGEVFTAPAPQMWDSGPAARGKAPAAAGGTTGTAADRTTDGAGIADRPTRTPPAGARRARLDVRVSGDRLDLAPDPAVLTDPGLRFPLYVDPAWQGTYNSAWAMVDSGYPNEEYWQFDGEANERVGNCPVQEGTCNNSRIKRLFYALPTPYQDDRLSIIAASFKVTMVHAYDSTARGVSLYRTGGISSATNWNNQPGGAGWSGAAFQESKSPTGRQGSCTSTNQNVEFNATNAVREAAANNWGTTTFGLRADNESDYHWLKRFCANATLSVLYNRAPDQPAIGNLSLAPGGSCVAGSGRPYVSTPPRLSAILTDPDTADAEPLSAQFRVTWTPPGGTAQTRTWTSPEKNTGSTFTFDLNDPGGGVPNLPENVVVSWDVRASDGTSWGPWSSDGSPPACEFILDKTKPTGPDVDSAEFLPLDAPDTAPACVPDETWYDGVGRWGTFTFDSSATDVYKYEYGFDTTPTAANTLTPASDGGPVTLRWLAQSEGPHVLQVRAVDRAGKTSDTTTCVFRVAAGSPAVAEWGLGDPAGSTSAADARGRAPAAAGPGVTFGAAGPGGAADPAVALTGASDSYLETTARALTDTGKGFSVSAWVRLASTAQNATAVSQSGSGEPGFTLGFDAASGKWEFELPSTDFTSLGTYRVLGPVAVVDEWTHLVATYDAETRTMSLYVNGGAPATNKRRSAWPAYGVVQLGRKQNKWGYAERWTGGLADVQMFNRLVVASEVTQLATLRPVRQGYWELDTATPTAADPAVLVSPEYSGDAGKELTLRGGASVYAPDPGTFPPPEAALVGAGHLVLDGTDDHAATVGPVAATAGSFTVAARVRLAAVCGRPMTVLSQPGTQASAFNVRCAVSGGSARWELVMPRTDTAGTPAAVTVYDDQRLPVTDSAGQHLAVTYNAFTNEVCLYVDGQLAASAKGINPDAWHAGAGGLQVGRAKVSGAWQDHFAGAIDDVRVYVGVLDQETVQRLANPVPQSDI